MRYVTRICWFLAAMLLWTAPLAAKLPTHGKLKNALKKVVAEENGGFGLHMWATIVDRDGVVQAVTHSGKERGDQWPGSRVISAQKASTANAFSLPGLSLGTGNLFTPVQPNMSLFGLQQSNPVDTDVAYGGNSAAIGTRSDPMVGQKIGGVNVFGGGLALYDRDGTLLGAIGLSGDSSCADHNIAWKVRHALNLDNVPGGVSATGDDNLVYDIVAGSSASGWGHAECSSGATSIAMELPTSHPIGPNPDKLHAGPRSSGLTVSSTRAKAFGDEVLGSYPNPFNSETVIRFAIPLEGQLNLSIYNISGQKVADLLSEDRQAGVHTVHWDGTSNQGEAVGSGIYFYRIEARKHVEMRKVMLLR